MAEIQSYVQDVELREDLVERDMPRNPELRLRNVRIDSFVLVTVDDTATLPPTCERLGGARRHYRGGGGVQVGYCQSFASAWPAVQNTNKCLVPCGSHCAPAAATL